MTSVLDPVFGKITFSDETGWTGSYTYPFLGRDVTVTLDLGGYDGEEIDAVQRDAFQRFKHRQNELPLHAEDAIFEYYAVHLSDLREQFGDSADEYCPLIDSKEELTNLVVPTSVFVKPPFVSDERVIGFLYDCTWDPSLGLAVKFVNESIEEVGPQDIVL